MVFCVCGRYAASRNPDDLVEEFEVEVVETTGCGDAFMAALLVRLLSLLPPASETRRADLDKLTTEQLTEALRWANAAGALTARQKGVMPALPAAEDVRRLLAE